MDGGTVTNLVSTCLADVPSAFSSCVNVLVDNALGALFCGFAIFGVVIKHFRSIRH